MKLLGYKFIDFDKNSNEIPNTTGVYIWLLKEDSVLPKINGCSPSFNTVEVNNSEYRVLYVGLAKDETLRDRIVKHHLKGNPRSSTLCYSIAAILKLPLYGKVEGKNRKIHLDKEHWNSVSNWLMQNCYLLVKTEKNPSVEEKEKIELFSAPINIQDNPNRKTDPYVVNLQEIRSRAKSLNSPSKSFGCLSLFVISFILSILAANIVLP